MYFIRQTYVKADVIVCFFPVCDPHWLHHRDSCYYFLDRPLNWNDSNVSETYLVSSCQRNRTWF